MNDRAETSSLLRNQLFVVPELVNGVFEVFEGTALIDAVVDQINERGEIEIHKLFCNVGLKNQAGEHLDQLIRILGEMLSLHLVVLYAVAHIMNNQTRHFLELNKRITFFSWHLRQSINIWLISP
jgi:hypothetical protein